MAWARTSRQARGYGREWELLREQVLRRDGGLCQPCLSAGKYTRGSAVDHILPKLAGGTDEIGNLQTICKPCHDTKTAKEGGLDGGRGATFPEWMPASVADLTIVCGPPGCGKTTYVAEHANRTDAVIDLDEILAEVSLKPLYMAGREWLDAALRLRNTRLADLSRSPTARAWFIVTGNKTERSWWREKLHPTSEVVLSTIEEVCIARIKADPRRSSIAQQQIQAVRRWWAAERGLLQPKRRFVTTGVDGWPV